MTQVLIQNNSSSALEVLLHPLVIINISDHFTRQKIRTKDPKARVVGVLLGTLQGRVAQLHTSFELTLTTVNNEPIIDTQYLATKKDQYSKVFPDYEVLGWYSTGSEVQIIDELIHKQIAVFSENPLYLLCNTNVSPAVKDLPIFLYEPIVSVADDKTQLAWAKLDYKIETEESERIAVDHVAHTSTIGSGDNQILSSSLVPHLSGVSNAVHMLNVRIDLITKYLDAVAQGAIPKDHQMLRQISCLCNKLPTIDSQTFHQDFTDEFNESLLISYLAMLTKGTTQLGDLVDKYNVTFDRNRHRRGMMF